MKTYTYFISLCTLFLINTTSITSQVVAPIDTLIHFTIETVKKEVHQKAIVKLNALSKSPIYPSAHDTSKSLLNYRMGVYNYKLNRDTTAIGCLNTALITATDNQLISEIYFLRATIQNGKWHQYAKARRDYQNAIKYREQTLERDLFKLWLYYHYTANNYISLKDFGNAEKYFSYSLDLANQFDEKHQFWKANAYNDIGTFYNDYNKPSKALEYLSKAVPIYKELKNILGLINVNNNFGAAYLILEDYDSSRQYFAEVLKYIEMLTVGGQSFPLEKSACLNNLGFSERKLGNFEKATKYYTTLKKLAEPIPELSEQLLVAYEGLADIAQDQAKYNIALQNYQKAIHYACLNYTAIDIFSNPSAQHTIIKDKRGLSRLLSLKANALQKNYQTTKQLPYLEASLETYKTLDSLIVQIRYSYQTPASKFFLQKEIIPIYEAAAKVALKLAVIKEEEKYEELAFHYCSKNKAIVFLEDQQGENAIKNIGIAPELRQQEQRLKKLIYEQEINIIDLEENNKDSLLTNSYKIRLDLFREYEALISKLETDYPKYHQLKYTPSIPLSFKKIQEKLPENTAFISYFVGDSSIIIQTISQSGLNTFVKNKPNNFKNLCENVRMVELTDTTEVFKNYAVAAHQLYQLLLETPLNAMRDVENINRLIIIPDDYLLQISFDNLLTEKIDIKAPDFSWTKIDDIPYLLQKFAIGYAYSNQLLFEDDINQRIQKNLKKFAGFGLGYHNKSLISITNKLEIDSARGAKLGRLLHAPEEVKTIAQAIEGDFFLNKNATKNSFLSIAEDYNILHLSMHGISDLLNPINSSLVFSLLDSNFLLRAADIYTLSLNADMVVLSACHSGEGLLQSGEGVISLARAFQYAGAKSVIASLWAASDLATKEIMVIYYQNLEKGMPKDIAMQQAKLNYLKTKKIATAYTPNFWSHLTVVGNTNPIVITSSIFSKKPLWCGIFMIGTFLLLQFYRKK